MKQCAIQYLLSLPPRMAAQFAELEGKPEPLWFATSDPPGRRIGSGGGTAHLLAEAWRRTGHGDSFSAWLRSSRKLIVHGGGQSRRLPAYAAAGKILMPMPVLRPSSGQRLDQTLLEIQLPDYERTLLHAPDDIVLMVTAGDVLLQFGRILPAFPDADVIGLGMRVTPEKAKDHGVFFTRRNCPSELAFCLQKPSPEKTTELSADFVPLIDTGMWLLTERAVNALMEQCGWDSERERFQDDSPLPYDLYTQMGAGLGSNPAAADPVVNALTSAVVPLPEPAFYHFGTTRQMIESVSELQTSDLDERKLGLVGAKRRPDQHILNSQFDYPLRLAENHMLWIENSVIPRTWKLSHEHVLTGAPENAWDLALEPGVCLDFVPIGGNYTAVRPYGFHDIFAGTLSDPRTLWLGRPAAEWFVARGLELPNGGDIDIQQAPLFPVLPLNSLEPRFIEWLFAATPVFSPQFSAAWANARRFSADALGAEANLNRVYGSRRARQRASLVPLRSNFRSSIFFKLDLASTAKLAATGDVLPDLDFRDDDDPMHAVHDQMFRAAVLRSRNDRRWREHETNAFGHLRNTIVREAQLSPALPCRSVLEDQIVWGRSPVRLDLAGGWSDTPPYCLEYGGRVLNVAVNLNGQPPIQVFARVAPQPELVVRSIDLGVEQRLRTYEELDTFAQPGSEFALAKAAFALAGFLPRFHAAGGSATLERQLSEFGGGIELSMLSAVPKGSGLGTSSILAATLLATLSDLCGLKWDKNVLFTRTLALEQLLTTGGGWQDQAGAIFRGIKLIETKPGLTQHPTVRWLPEHLLSRDYANRTVLLYYTGITRLAKGILQEIVRGMFLNSPTHLRLTAEIADNAESGFTAIQECDYNALVETIHRSWDLNQRLDSGTNPPAVQDILDRCGKHLAAAKLLGAGGGGFLLIFARDENAAAHIRQNLSSNAPNPRARFFDMEVSDTGLQLTRS